MRACCSSKTNPHPLNGIFWCWKSSSFVQELNSLSSVQQRQLGNCSKPVFLISQIFERLIRDRRVHHFTILSPKIFFAPSSMVHGFRLSHSCSTTLTTFWRTWSLTEMASIASTHILDCAKAIDKVYYSMMIRRLCKYGINPKMIILTHPTSCYFWRPSFANLQLLSSVEPHKEQCLDLPDTLFLIFLCPHNSCGTFMEWLLPRIWAEPQLLLCLGAKCLSHPAGSNKNVIVYIILLE